MVVAFVYCEMNAQQGAEADGRRGICCCVNSFCWSVHASTNDWTTTTYVLVSIALPNPTASRLLSHQYFQTRGIPIDPIQSREISAFNQRSHRLPSARAWSSSWCTISYLVFTCHPRWVVGRVDKRAPARKGTIVLVEPRFFRVPCLTLRDEMRRN